MTSIQRFDPSGLAATVKIRMIFLWRSERVEHAVIDMPFGDERGEAFPVEGRIFLRRETGCGEFSMNIPKTYPLEGRMQMRWNVKIAPAK